MLKVKMKKPGKMYMHPSIETLAAFVENSLGLDEIEEVQYHLKNCIQCFESMAALRKSTTEREQMEFQQTPDMFVIKAKSLVVSRRSFLKRALISTRKKNFSLLRYNFLRWLKWRFAVPVMTVATVATILFIMLKTTSPIDNDSLGNRMFITEFGPLGFAGEGRIVKFRGMKVDLSKDKKDILLTWPEVDGAEFYHIDLMQGGERKRITPAVGIQETSFSYPVQNLVINAKYIWEISGKMKSEYIFYAKAGFLWKK